MKKIFTPFFIAVLAIINTKAVAQTSTACNADFTYSFVNGTEIQFTPAYNTDSALVYHTWIFGDGTAAQDVYAPLHTFPNAGTTYTVKQYIVKLGTNKAVVCTDTVTKSIFIPVIDPLPCNIQSYFYDSISTVTPGKVYFLNETVNRVSSDSMYWDFGDGTSSRDSNVSHIYAQTGTYNVCLTVTRVTVPGAAPCTSKFCRTVVIQTPCNLTANFSYKKDSTSTALYAYVFDNTSTGNYDSSYWDFGDGSSSYDKNPTHTYATSGSYTVCLYIKNAVSSAAVAPCTSHICETIVIQPVCNTKANYTWKVDSLKANTIDFTNTTTPIATNASVKWIFGDGSPIDSTTWNATHTYAQPGKYYVCLRVQTSNTCVSYQCDSVTIPTPVCNTKANYTWKVDSLKANTIDFTNTTTPINTTASVKWIFGDGSPIDSTTWNATHTYSQPGKYYVCLRVQTSASCLSYQCDSVTVPAPNACNIQSYFYDSTSTSNPSKIYFLNETLNRSNTDSYYWSFGDSTYSQDSSPVHIYSKPGTYDACLTVTKIVTPGTAQCISKFCRTITIQPICNLVAGFTYAKDSTAANINTYHFTNTSTGSYDSSFWNFGDGTPVSHDMNPTHAFATTGTYTVCLYIEKATTVSGAVPCTASICKKIVVTSTVCNLKANYTWQLDSINHFTVHFTNTTITPVTTISSRWFFGDGTSDSAWNTTHTFNQPGKYYVCLRVQTATNCVSYQCDSVTIPTPAPNCKQLSLFTAVPSVTNSQTYTFTPVYGTSGVAYTWTFGDMDGSQYETAIHHYINPGIYTTCLTAYRDSNCATTTCKEIVVRPQIICDSIHISFNAYKNGNELNKVYFYVEGNYPITQETWTITSLASTSANPVTITERNPTYVFSDTGYYQVCLRAVTISGCVKEYCTTVHIQSVVTYCELYAYPNPANTQVSISVLLNSPEMIHAFVYNSQSILVSDPTQQGVAGNNIVTINTANLTAGVYTVKLIYGNNICYAKFQKL